MKVSENPKFSDEHPRPQFKYGVESGIPCPPKTARGGPGGDNTALYPFKIMEVDESFFVPLPDGGDLARFKLGVANSISGQHKFGTKRFVWRTRKRETHGEDGVRVWRIK